MANFLGIADCKYSRHLVACHKFCKVCGMWNAPSNNTVICYDNAWVDDEWIITEQWWDDTVRRKPKCWDDTVRRKPKCWDDTVRRKPKCWDDTVRRKPKCWDNTVRRKPKWWDDTVRRKPKWWDDTVRRKPKCWAKNHMQAINMYHLNIFEMRIKFSVYLIWKTTVYRCWYRVQFTPRLTFFSWPVSELTL